MAASATLIREKYETINNEIRQLSRREGRPEVSVIVVSKSQPAEVIHQAYLAGIRKFGENYPQETEKKILELPELPAIEWHMIGHLQSRKAVIVARHFCMMHSVDSLRVAEKLNLELVKVNKTIPVLLEVNAANEESKSGWSIADRRHWDGLLEEIQKIINLSNLVVSGLMAMPPLSENPESSRPHFKTVKKFQQFLSDCFPGQDWHELSMGTSMDYQVAVQEGATMVRIGQAILGPRSNRL